MNKKIEEIYSFWVDDEVLFGRIWVVGYGVIGEWFVMFFCLCNEIVLSFEKFVLLFVKFFFVG